MTPPAGIPVSEYQQSTSPNGVALWRTFAALLVGLTVGMTTAWWTALQSKGVNQKDLEEYVGKYSPYLMDKSSLLEHNAEQDRLIGELKGRQDRVIDRLTAVESTQKLDENDRTALKTKMDFLANLLEEERKVKR